MTAGGIAISIVVLVMVVVSVTLLPALLGLAGHRINRRGTRRPRGPARAPRTRAGGDGSGTSPRTRGRTRSAPSRLLLAARRARARACVPASPTTVRCPSSRTERRAYDLVAQGFGPGSNGPLVVAVDTAGDPTVLGAAGEPRSRLTPGSPPSRPRGRTPAAGSRQCDRDPHHGPQEPPPPRRSSGCARDVLPGVVGGGPAQAHVGGATANFADVGRRVNERLPGVGRGRARDVVRPAHAGLPVGARAAQGRGPQPAQHRCGVRRDGHGVPVGLGRRPASGSSRPCRSSPSSRCSCSRSCSGSRWTTRCSCCPGCARSTCAPATTGRRSSTASPRPGG